VISWWQKINVDKLQEGLNTKNFGKKIVFLCKVASTNDLAKNLVSYGADEGTVVLAESQFAGKGRLGRLWVSPEGGLYFSVILKPKIKPAETIGLIFVAGLAVAEVLRELYGLEVETKWPNDVLVNGRKVCGVLSEANVTGEKVNFVIVGVGVNANFDVESKLPKALWEHATSLMAEIGTRISLDVLFKALLEKLESFYKLFLKEGLAPILDEWKKYAVFLGNCVEVVSEDERFTGLALDVKDNGSLAVKLKDGTVKHVFVGDVSLRRKQT